MMEDAAFIPITYDRAPLAVPGGERLPADLRSGP